MVRLPAQEPLELQFREPLVERVEVGAQMFLGFGVVGVDDGQKLFQLVRLGFRVAERDVQPLEELQLLDDGVAVVVLRPKIGARDLPLELLDARPAAVDVKDTSASSRCARGRVEVFP